MFSTVAPQQCLLEIICTFERRGEEIEYCAAGDRPARRRRRCSSEEFLMNGIGVRDSGRMDDKGAEGTAMFDVRA